VSGEMPVSAAERRSRFNPTVAHPARRYDYWLGGKDNYPADRESGDAIAAAWPGIRTAAIENRAFMRRAVRFLAEQGVCQFLDVGTGIPTSPNVHEVAQRVTPTARIVYVDNDPLVLTHARALMVGTPNGDIGCVDADLREPDRILADVEARRVLDLSRPVALLLVAVLHFIPDDDDPYAIVARLVDALPVGSYVVASHATYDPLPQPAVQKLQTIAATGPTPFQGRTLAQFIRFFNGLHLLPPGIVSVAQWRAETERQPRPAAADVACYGAVAGKP
jgi:S-adenosyl methyltransferase